MAMTDVFNDVVAERWRQDGKWGVQSHAMPVWMAILMEEVGEAAQEAVKATFAESPARRAEHTEELRVELVQVAAVAVAIIEQLDYEAFHGHPRDVADILTEVNVVRGESEEVQG